MNLKDLTKELLGRSLNKYCQDTGMSSLDSVNERQDLLLNQLYKDTSIDYVEKTFDDRSTKLVASDNGAIEVMSFQGNTKYKVDGVITDTWKEGCEILGVGDYDKDLNKFKIEILSCGKNLFDKRFDYKDDFTFVNSTLNFDADKYIITGIKKLWSYFLQNNPIKLKPKTKYIINIKGYSTLNKVLNIGSDKHQDSAQYGTILMTKEFKVYTKIINTDSSGNLYIKGYTNYVSEEKGELGIEYIEILEAFTGDISDNYQQYISDETQILLKEPLMKLPNSVCDEYKDGRVTRRIGKRDYQTDDENKADVITDKKVTYYELETPVIEDVGLSNPLLMKGFEEGHLSFNTLISPEATIRYRIDNKLFEEIEEIKAINENVKKTIEQTYPTLMNMDISLLDLENKIQDKLKNRIRVK